MFEATFWALFLCYFFNLHIYFIDSLYYAQFIEEEIEDEKKYFAQSYSAKNDGSEFKNNTIFVCV